MRHGSTGRKFNRRSDQRRAMFQHLASALIKHEQIITTLPKAKDLRPIVEKLVTLAKKGDLHARRQVLTVVRDKAVVHTLFAEIGPRFAERPGGYTRITKIGPRKGDNAPMAVIELVEAKTIAQEAVGEAEKARGTKFARRKTKGEGAVEEALAPAEATDAAPETEAADAAPEVEAEAAPEVEATDEAPAAEAAPEVEAPVVEEPEAPASAEAPAEGATEDAPDAAPASASAEDPAEGS
jgi:large subunit ribosomal protein L17